MIRVQTADFDLAEEYAALRRDNAGPGGAIVTFTGLVREFAGPNATAGAAVASAAAQPCCLSLQHYPGMTERLLADILDQARQRWQLLDTRVIHRVGDLAAGDQIVFVGVCARHRGEAFAAAEFIMDYLKTRATFWKKETGPEGSRWVEARDSDRASANRWQNGDD